MSLKPLAQISMVIDHRPCASAHSIHLISLIIAARKPSQMRYLQQGLVAASEQSGTHGELGTSPTCSPMEITHSSRKPSGIQVHIWILTGALPSALQVASDQTRSNNRAKNEVPAKLKPSEHLKAYDYRMNMSDVTMRYHNNENPVPATAACPRCCSTFHSKHKHNGKPSTISCSATVRRPHNKDVVSVRPSLQR